MLPVGAISTSRRNTNADAYSILTKSFYVSEVDMEYAFTQLMYLCLTPRRVYQLTTYRKQIQNYWARDDPGMIILQLAYLLGVATAFSIALAQSWHDRLMCYTNVVLIQFVGCGLFLTSVYHYVCENFLRTSTDTLGTTQSVEWLYCLGVLSILCRNEYFGILFTSRS
jgi:UNC-50 family